MYPSLLNCLKTIVFLSIVKTHKSVVNMMFSFGILFCWFKPRFIFDFDVFPVHCKLEV